MRDLRRAKEAEELLKAVVPRPYEKEISKQTLAQMGEDFWSALYEGGDDFTLDARAQAYAEALTDPLSKAIFEAALEMPDQQVLFFGAARWFDQGLPVIRLGHKRAASFMATSVSAVAAEHIVPPFKAFFIEMPDGLLALRDDKGAERKVTGILVHSVDMRGRTRPPGEGTGRYEETTLRWRYAAITGSSFTQWELNRKTEEVAGHNVRENQWEGIGCPIDDYDQRVSMLIGRLICSVCLMMSNGKIPWRYEPVLKTGSGKKPKPGSPKYRVFAPATPILNDVRPAIAAYLHGDWTVPESWRYVAGHYKMQPYGPMLSLRKHIWVEPYEREIPEGMERQHGMDQEDHRTAQ